MCNFAASQKGSYVKHVKSVHHKVKEEKCQLRDYSAYSSFDIKLHIKRVHLNMVKLKQYSCNYCDYQAIRKDHLEDHRWNHRSQDEIKCMECSKSFATRATLVRHVKHIHLNIRQFECNLCGKSFYYSGVLKVHTEMVHVEVKDQKCMECDKMFSHKNCLDNHVRRVHQSLASSKKCEVCDKKVSHMKRHMTSMHS